MSEITSPSGRVYQWEKPTPPTKEDIDALVAYDSQLGGQPQSQGPATIGEMRRREEQGLVGALPPDMSEAVKRSAEVGGLERFVGEMGRLPEPSGQIAPPEYQGGRIAPSGQLTPMAQAESRGMRKASALYAATVPSLVAAPFIAGLGPVTAALVEGGIGVASQGVSQTISPDEYKGGEMAAAAVPGFNIGQKASKLKQITLGVGSGTLTSAAQAGLESLDDESANYEDILFRTGLGGFLSMAGETVPGAIGAVVRARSVNPRLIAAEFERPFTQQFIKDRGTEIQKELERRGAGGLSSQFADNIARTLYSPNSGLKPDEFRNNIAKIVSDSFSQGSSSGLSTSEISDSIKTQLGNYVQNADKIAGEAVDQFVTKSEKLVTDVTNIIDQKNASRNKRLTDLVRGFEGRYTTDSQPLINQINDLEAKKKLLPDESIERKRIEDEISVINQQVQDIQAGAVRGYGPASGISKEELGQRVQEIGREELQFFKDESNKGYGKLEPRLDKVKITSTEIGPDGKKIVKTANQLRKERSEILKEIDFNKQVQKADYSVFEELDKINGQLDKALLNDPGLKGLLEAENKFYSTGISRFKGFFADKVLREAGEAGGMPGIVSTVAGASGAQNLKLLKNMLGNRYGEIEPSLREFVYTQIKGENPNDFLKGLTKGKGGYATGIQKEVINDLFPDLSEINEVASKYGSLIDQRAVLEGESKNLSSQINGLTKQVDDGIKGAQEKLNAVNSQFDKVTSKIAVLKASNVTERENEIIKSLGKIRAEVNKAGASKSDALDSFKLDEVVRELSTEGGLPLYKALERAVEVTSAAKDRFYGVVKKSMQPGGQLESFNPSNLIDFLAPGKGAEISSDYRVRRFMEVVGKERPDLINDAQNMLIGRIVAESFDGTKIDTKKLSSLVGNSEAPGKYYEATQRLLGKDGEKRINNVANQLSQFSNLGKPSVFTKIIAPTLATAIGYQISKGAGAGIGLGGYIAYKGVEKGMKEAVDAAVGRILKTPEYLDIVSKPLDAATKGQIDKIERMWPRILKMETDRVMLNKEEAEPVLSSARQTLDNVSQSVSNFFGR
jgi:predicted  nucleic acid-binding Zn-ribbon protein